MTTAPVEAGLVRQLPWDSDFWGLRMVESEYPQTWTPLYHWDFNQARVPSRDMESIAVATKQGFVVADIRVTLDRPLNRRPPISIEEIRPYQDTDLDVLVQIARTSHRITRFYADPGFPDDRCDDYYEGWIRNSVDGWADAVLVAGQPAHGYVTVHVEGETASIGLIAVDKAARGRGVGQRLVHGAVRWAHAAGASRMTVVTQGRNIEAQRVFQRCGFLTCATEVWLHRWFR